jgi:preprotein translocase subunit SecE
MATEEDLKKAGAEDESSEEEATDSSPDQGQDEKAEIQTKSEAPEASEEDRSEADLDDDDGAPMQLGHVRYVYAAYMAGAMLIAFLVAKIGHLGWYRLGQWKPELGEPKDEIVYVTAGIIGALVALYYWRKPESRQYANEVAEELSKVTWPSRKEVTNSTTVVILTTLFATVFFALMDQFWRYVTDKIYSF